ncbi:hypothetical protein BX666DRAFT_2024232 [Dichotomocladium elegans]|nr:hypothetical protein BX666DRAFT_2024232 [Dichotomocladium elegans]
MNFTCGCLLDKAAKEPHFKKTKYFEDLSASFALNTKNEQLSAHYSWLVQMHRQIPGVSNPYVEATFEDPVDKEHPINVPAIQLKSTGAAFEHPRYYVISPALSSIDCGLYKMRLTAYADASKQRVLAEHDNMLLSRVNTSTCTKTEFMERMNAAARHAEKQWQSSDST